MFPDLETSISQYLDGTLPGEQRAPMEALLARDPAARAMLEKERALTALLQSQALPQIHWGQLARQIAAQVDQLSPAHRRAVPWIFRLRGPGLLAMAASVLLAAGIAVHFLLGPGAAPAPASHPNLAAPTALLVQGPEPEVSAGPAILDVSVGPGGSYANASSLAPYADQIDTRPAHVVIAAGYSPRPMPPEFPF